MLAGQGWTWSWVITHSQLQYLELGMGLETSHGPPIVPSEHQDYPEPANGAGEVNSLGGLPQGPVCSHPTPAFPHVRGALLHLWDLLGTSALQQPCLCRAEPPGSPSTGLWLLAGARGSLSTAHAGSQLVLLQGRVGGRGHVALQKAVSCTPGSGGYFSITSLVPFLCQGGA